MNTFVWLNWAQWGSVVCGIGVVVFSFISTGIQKREDQIKSDREQKYKDTIIAITKDNLTLTTTNNDLIKRVQSNQDKQIELTKEIKNDQKEALSPDLRITGGQIIGNKIYRLTVKNSGKSTAEKPKLYLKYSYAPEIIVGTKELPAGSSYNFDVEIFPFDDRNLADLGFYKDIKGKFAKGERALIVNISIEYEWQGKKITSQKYTLINDGKELLLN